MWMQIIDEPETRINFDWEPLYREIKEILAEDYPSRAKEITGLNAGSCFVTGLPMDVIRLQKMKINFSRLIWISPGEATDIAVLQEHHSVLKTAETEAVWEKIGDLCRKAISEDKLIYHHS